MNTVKNEEIENLNEYDKIQMELFGKQKWVSVFSTVESQYDEDGDYIYTELTEEELDLLNWFINNVKIEDYKREIMDYLNSLNHDDTQNRTITIEDVENEINITSIVIDIDDRQKSDGDALYPEISFFGECNRDIENGICIGFRDKKFIGVKGQDWIL